MAPWSGDRRATLHTTGGLKVKRFVFKRHIFALTSATLLAGFAFAGAAGAYINGFPSTVRAGQSIENIAISKPDSVKTCDDLRGKISITYDSYQHTYESSYNTEGLKFSKIGGGPSNQCRTGFILKSSVCQWMVPEGTNKKDFKKDEAQDNVSINSKIKGLSFAPMKVTRGATCYAHFTNK